MKFITRDLQLIVVIVFSLMFVCRIPLGNAVNVTAPEYSVFPLSESSKNKTQSVIFSPFNFSIDNIEDDITYIGSNRLVSAQSYLEAVEVHSERFYRTPFYTTIYYNNTIPPAIDWSQFPHFVIDGHGKSGSRIISGVNNQQLETSDIANTLTQKLGLPQNYTGTIECLMCSSAVEIDRYGNEAISFARSLSLELMGRGYRKVTVTGYIGEMAGPYK